MKFRLAVSCSCTCGCPTSSQGLQSLVVGTDAGKTVYQRGSGDEAERGQIEVLATSAFRLSASGIQVAGHLSVGVAQRNQFGCHFVADVHDLGAAAGEAAAGSNVHRRGDFAPDRS